MAQHWLKHNSFLDTTYDYMVSLGHRCCVGQGLHYMRKSSFPFDWQITQIDGLYPMFKNELKDIYPGNGAIEWVHTIHYPSPAPGEPEGPINEEATIETYKRRSERLVKLLKDNNRKLLFIRGKYTNFWYDHTNDSQKDMYSVEYDLQELIKLSNLFKTQYGNNNFHILYVYQDTRKWPPLNYKDGVCSHNDYQIPGWEESVSVAQNKFVYIEQDGFKDLNITPVIVYPGPYRLEANRWLTEVFRDIKLSDGQDFKLPYNFA